MPDLSARQFEQTDLGLNVPTVAPTPPPKLPDKWGLRGAVGEGQMALNFEMPAVPLVHDAGGFIPVDSFRDPGYDSRMWEFGGRERQSPYERDRTPEVDFGNSRSWVTAGWENSPVETITPDMQVYTGQTASFGEDSVGYEYPLDLLEEGDHIGLQVQRDDHKVDKIRAAGDAVREGGFTPEGREMPPQRPWVAHIGDRRYLLEGHHRGIAARNSRDGNFDAHVLRADSVDDLHTQLEQRADDVAMRQRYGDT
jgi:hypothetical protein